MSQIAIQVNGKTCTHMHVPPENSQVQNKSHALSHPKVIESLGGRAVSKVISLKTLVNIITK